MQHNSDSTQPSQKTLATQSYEWLSRGIAVVLLMVLPGALGMWLDNRTGLVIFGPIGFVLGMIFAIVMLQVLIKIKPIVAPESSQVFSEKPVQSTSEKLESLKRSQSEWIKEHPAAEILEPRDD